MGKKTDHIIGLVGKSGSGKTAVAEYFKNKGYNVIESYTDRPKRYENEEGHIYIKTEEVELYKEEMIAYTFFDGHHYFATRSQYVNKGVTFYTIDPIGVVSLEENVKDANLTIIYINVDDSIRRERMFNRCIKGNGVEDEERINMLQQKVERRIEHDKKAFSVVKCNYVVDNNSQLIDTVREIEKIIGTIL
jgi:guanylate kinase